MTSLNFKPLLSILIGEAQGFKSLGSVRPRGPFFIFIAYESIAGVYNSMLYGSVFAGTNSLLIRMNGAVIGISGFTYFNVSNSIIFPILGRFLRLREAFGR
jgi:hypothetical protein